MSWHLSLNPPPRPTLPCLNSLRSPPLHLLHPSLSLSVVQGTHLHPLGRARLQLHPRLTLRLCRFPSRVKGRALARSRQCSNLGRLRASQSSTHLRCRGETPNQPNPFCRKCKVLLSCPVRDTQMDGLVLFLIVWCTMSGVQRGSAPRREPRRAPDVDPVLLHRCPKLLHRTLSKGTQREPENNTYNFIMVGHRSAHCLVWIFLCLCRLSDLDTILSFRKKTSLIFDK